MIAVVAQDGTAMQNIIAAQLKALSITAIQNAATPVVIHVIHVTHVTHAAILATHVTVATNTLISQVVI